MADQFETQQNSLDDDLRMLTETLEEVLKSSGDKADEKYVQIKARAENALKDIRLTAMCVKIRGMAWASVPPSAWL